MSVEDMMVADIPLPLLIQLLDQFYLRRNGKRAMTGDLDMGANLLENALELRTVNMKFDELSVSQMRLRKISTGAFASLRCNIEIPGVIQSQASGGVFFQTFPTLLNRHWIFRAYDGSTMQICAYLGGPNADDANFRIPRAGDIEAVAGATIGNVNPFAVIKGLNLVGTNLVGTEAVLIPSSVLASAVARNIRYNVATNVFEIHDGAAWNALISATFGGISVVGNAVETAIAVAGTKVQFTLFDTDDAESNADADHTNDHIVIQKAGTYMITVSIHAESVAGGGATFAFDIYKNNGATPIANLHAHRTFAGGGGADAASVGLSGLVSLAVNDTVELWITNDTGTENILIEDVTLSLVISS